MDGWIDVVNLLEEIRRRQLPPENNLLKLTDIIPERDE